jgi:alkylation response protein AidB-like acyl-CoA dehydrogenase
VLVDDDGKLGANDLRVGGLEHKLGIHGSPTCVMLFEGAKAELVGGLGQGLPNMFVMMNAARLQVGAQGVAIAERAYQQALNFSQERVQGRSAWTGANPAPDLRPPGRAPHAGADEGPYRGRAGHLPVDRRRRRPGARRRRRGRPARPPSCARSC